MHDIFVAGVWHESNTFSPLPADLARFRAYQWLEGEALFAELRATNTEIGGMLEAAAACEFRLHPGIYAAAVPCGPVPLEAFEAIVGKLLAALRGLEGIDGALLALHGAMVVEALGDGDAALLRRVRAAIGTIPIVATFDLHANLSDATFALADMLIGYDTLPHVDAAERGREAAFLLQRMLRTGERPAKALRRLPLITVPQMQATADEPMVSIMRAAHVAERKLWCCSVVPGFAYADVEHLGFSIVAYGDALSAEEAAQRLADLVWSRRAAFLPTLTPAREAVDRAQAGYDGKGPAILAEPADNVGGGAPGDATFVLEAMLQARADGAVIVLWDPAAVEAAMRAGVGGRLNTRVGGHASELSGPPVAIDGVVEFIDRVRYRRSGPYMTGQAVDMGRVAIVDCAGVKIVLTGERVMPFDSDHLSVLGIEPQAQRLICVKSGTAWRAGFERIAASAIYVDTPGVCASNISHLPYRRVRRPIFPLDQEVIR